jgi:dipeptidyl aminopeptidase/acylaminoacyl peptidase
MIDMHFRGIKLCGAGLLICFLGIMAAAQKRPFTFEEMMKVKRLADPQLSPNAKMVAYTITTIDVEKNSRESHLWITPLPRGEAIQLTRGSASEDSPRWSPDGRRLAFISRRSGASKIWIIPVDGGEAALLDTGSLEVTSVLWSPDGKNLLFASEIFPECQDSACNDKQSKEQADNPVKAKVLVHLLFRHWNFWKDGKRSHLFLIPAEGGVPRDLTPGDFDTPPFSLGGPGEYAFSPDGGEICYTSHHESDEALSTNGDLFTVSLDGLRPRKITSNPADDAGPVYSPDGRWIAYRAQRRPGYEADRWELMLFDRSTGKNKSLTAELDKPVESYAWSPDSQWMYFVAGDEARAPIFKVALNGGPIQKVLDSHENGDLQFTPDGEKLVLTHQSLSQPAEIYTVSKSGASLSPLTTVNQDLLSGLDLREPESVWFTGAEGARVQAWILKPPRFDATTKYPMLFAIHGGPQGVWGDAMSYRWNLQVFAARGYVVMAVNPRGSTTFGQNFTDGIRGDWGGKVYEDLMKGLDYAISLGYVDPNRVGAAGGSYGGYLVNWLAGHSDRFHCLISHAGVFNLTSDYGVTEELWFPEWEFLGPPWKSRDLYEKWSPHMAVQNFKTPTLVIHGELDYRVPVGEGFQMFTSLQRQKVPSKMLYFPDEGHWVNKPKNSELWYRTFLEWLDQFLK